MKSFSVSQNRGLWVKRVMSCRLVVRSPIAILFYEVNYSVFPGCEVHRIAGMGLAGTGGWCVLHFFENRYRFFFNKPPIALLVPRKRNEPQRTQRAQRGEKEQFRILFI